MIQKMRRKEGKIKMIYLPIILYCYITAMWNQEERWGEKKLMGDFASRLEKAPVGQLPRKEVLDSG